MSDLNRVGVYDLSDRLDNTVAWSHETIVGINDDHIILSNGKMFEKLYYDINGGCTAFSCGITDSPHATFYLDVTHIDDIVHISAHDNSIEAKCKVKEFTS